MRNKFPCQEKFDKTVSKILFNNYIIKVLLPALFFKIEKATTSMSQTHTLLLEAENKTENDAAAAQLKFDFERLASRATKPRLTSRKGEFSEAARL